MAFTVIQAGSTLQLVASDGTLAPLTLPSGIELRQDVPPRWAVYGRSVILVNTPNRPVTIDSTGTVRPLTPLPPRLAAVLHGADPVLTGFRLSTTPVSASVVPGTSTVITIHIARAPGFTAAVTIPAFPTGLPADVSPAYGPNPTTAATTTLTLTAAATATLGTVTIAFTGTSPGVSSQTVSMSLTVSPTTVPPVTPSGTLTGTYRVLYTHVMKDSVGNIISESDYSPTGNAATITNEMLLVSSIDVSPDPVDARRLYRTTTNGAVYFQWIDLDGNVLTTIQDDLADAGLGETAGPVLGTPPRLTLIAEFRDRLFGVGDFDLDSVVYTETGIMYAWSPLNTITIPRVGSDTRGVTGLAGRREALGVGRLNRLSQIVGTGEESNGIADLRLIKLSDETGFLGQESIAVYRDTVYFLWFDGVYEWSDNGLVCLSDGNSQGQARVRSWFATDDYFDRRLFARAFAQIDPNRNVYRLFLNDPAGVRSYVEFDLINRVWYGPHRIEAFTARSAFLRLSATDVKVPTLGATDGGIYAVDGRAADVALTGQPFGIAFDVDTRPFAGSSPDRVQYFGELSVLGRSQPAGTLTITPRLGYLDADGGVVLTPQPPIAHSLRKGREHLRRLGTGALAQLNLTHDGVDEEVSILGIEISDVHEVGRR